MVLSGVLSACLSPSRRLADGKKYPDQYSVELETKVHVQVLTGALPKVCRDAKLVRQRM